MAKHSVYRSGRRGVMLLIVTLVLTALTLSGAALLTLMKTENEATTTRGRESLVKGVDRSAVVFLIGALDSSQEEREKFGGLYDNPKYFCAAPLLTLEEGGADTSRFTVLSPTLVNNEIEGVRYGLVDESTRLNLQAALEWDRETPGSGRAALMKLPGMTQIAADSILDWIDADETARQSGAEARYYADKKLPYSPRNSTPVFLEEILLARGVTRAQLYGTDENFTYNIDQLDGKSSAPLGGSLTGVSSSVASRSVSTPWKELLTVFSAEKDVDPAGAARVSLNVDNLEFLYSELSSRVGDDLAKFIVLYRQYGPIETTSGSDSAPASGARRPDRASGYTRGSTSVRGQTSAPGSGVRGDLRQATLDYTVASTTTFTTPLDVVGARVQVGDVYYDSPIRDSRDQRNIETLFTLLDYASTSASTTIIGRVNINAAPRPVLSAIPGVTSATLESILDRRPDPKGALPREYRHASWLYAQGIVDLPLMKRLYNKTTARGDVYRGQVIGFLERSDETSRAEVVIAGTTEPPRQVFYKDLTSLGKGFPDAVLIGGKSAEGDGALGAGQEDAWSKTNELFELERSESGYTSGASEDPFAAVDLATGAPSPGETDAAAALEAAVESATATPESESSEPEPEPTQSRRERALQTLRDARAERSARNRAAINGTNAQTSESTAEVAQEQPVPEPATVAPPAAQERDSEDRAQRALDALRSVRGARRGGAQTPQE